MTKPTKWSVCPVKTQISLGIHPVWSESSLRVQWVAKDPSFLHADSEDSDQTGPMPRLIWVFAGRTCHFVGFDMRRLMYDTRNCMPAWETVSKVTNWFHLKMYFQIWIQFDTRKAYVSVLLKNKIGTCVTCKIMLILNSIQAMLHAVIMKEQV